MNSHPAIAGFDVALKRPLLTGVQHIAAGVEKDHRLVLRKNGVGKLIRVFGGVRRKIVRRGERLDGRNAIRDRRMPESGSCGENQNFIRGLTERGCSEKEPDERSNNNTFHNNIIRNAIKGT